MEQVKAYVVFASCFNKALTGVYVNFCLCFLVRKSVDFFAFLPLSLNQSAHLLLIHIECRVVANDTQDAGQIHELEGLSRLSIDFLPPVLEMIHLSTVLNVEDVKLLLY